MNPFFISIIQKTGITTYVRCSFVFVFFVFNTVSLSLLLTMRISQQRRGRGSHRRGVHPLTVIRTVTVTVTVTELKRRKRSLTVINLRRHNPIFFCLLLRLRRSQRTTNNHKTDGANANAKQILEGWVVHR